MDNLTHAFAGCLIAAGTIALVERRGKTDSPAFRRAATVVALVGAEIPDVDLFYSGRLLDHGRLGYLLHHRGYTHTIVFAVLAALLLWCATLALRRRLRARALCWPLLALALVATFSHIALDYTNSYGVHPFWPVRNTWYYGDAVFIVEPWLWIVSLPALLFAFRNRLAQGFFAFALVAILVAAWRIAMVGTTVALALTVGALLWTLVMWAAAGRRCIALGILAWCGVEAMFFVSSHRARDAVRALVSPPTLRDVALTPLTGNPLCFRALVVQLDGTVYRITSAVVAPWPQLKDAVQCGGRRETRILKGVAPVTPTSAVSWDREWSAEQIELVALVAANCEVRTALRFMRVPFWRSQGDGTLDFFDLRFGDGGSFATIATAERRRRCRWTPPPWMAPRRDVAGDAVMVP